MTFPISIWPIWKAKKIEGLNWSILNYISISDSRTIPYETDFPTKHLVFKHNIFFTYLWDKDDDSLQLDILSIKPDRKELGGLGVTRRPKEIVFYPNRRDLQDINKDQFFYRNMMYISKRNIIRLDDDSINIFNFF